MPDNKRKRGKADRLRINVKQDYEVRDWSAKFGISAFALRAAVEAAGPMVKDVKKYLIDKIRKAGGDEDEIQEAPQG